MEHTQSNPPNSGGFSPLQKIILAILMSLAIAYLPGCASSSKTKSTSHTKLDEQVNTRTDSTGSKAKDSVGKSSTVASMVNYKDSSGTTTTDKKSSSKITVNFGPPVSSPHKLPDTAIFQGGLRPDTAALVPRGTLPQQSKNLSHIEDGNIKKVADLVYRPQPIDGKKVPANDYEGAEPVYDVTVNGKRIKSNQPINSVVFEENGEEKTVKASELRTRDSTGTTRNDSSATSSRDTASKGTETARNTKFEQDTSDKNKQRKGIATGFWITGVIVLLLAGVAWYFGFFRRRRRKAAAKQQDEQ